MAASGDDLEPPFMVEMDGSALSAYQSITFHPTVQNMSFEELRVQHCSIECDESLLNPTGTSKLMATWRLSALATTYQLRPIRAAPDATHRLDGDVIVFLIGTDAPKRFTIHENLIRPRSEFVRLALRGEWKEARERTIPFPEDDPEVFSVYQQWLYGGRIHTYSSNNALFKPDDEYKTLVQAYILGEKIMDQDFEDSIADAIVEKLRSLRRFDASLTDLVFDNTPSGLPLRRLWMDVY